MPIPLVTIVIPSFNRASLIGETLDSVLAQTDPRWECIVVDDGSTDGTQDVAQGYAAKDPRIRFISRDREPKGANACRNIGAAAASGAYVLFLDSDDLLVPSIVHDIGVDSSVYPDVDMLVYDFNVFTHSAGDAIPRKIPEGVRTEHFKRFCLLAAPWAISCTAWRSEAVRALGFPEDVTRLQDIEVHLRAIACGCSYQLTHKASFCWREDIRSDRISRAAWDGRSVTNQVLFVKSFLRPGHAIRGVSASEYRQGMWLMTVRSIQLITMSGFALAALQQLPIIWSTRYLRVTRKLQLTLYLLSLYVERGTARRLLSVPAADDVGGF